MSLTEQVGQALTRPDGLAEALRLIIAHFHADTGTIHLLEADGVLHLKAERWHSARRAGARATGADREGYGWAGGRAEGTGDRLQHSDGYQRKRESRRQADRDGGRLGRADPGRR